MSYGKIIDGKNVLTNHNTDSIISVDYKKEQRCTQIIKGKVMPNGKKSDDRVCGKLLFRGMFDKGQIEIMCTRCRMLSKIKKL